MDVLHNRPPAHRHIWHPFTQHQQWDAEDPLVIESGKGVYLTDSEGTRYIDGVSSLWCNVHGHAHPVIDAAVKKQLDRVAHTTMLGLTHRPAIELADRLIELAPDGLTRVFYSDNGSTAAEIALKMAFQYWKQTQPNSKRNGFIAMKDAYHGDTIGSVSVGGIELFHSLYRPLLFETWKANPGDSDDVERLLQVHAGEVAGVIVEPLVQGAAGMIMHPPGFLADLRRLCDQYDVLLICDEVAVGFGRTGAMFGSDHEGVSPDLMCLAKGLSGGYLPLAATLATERIYDGFLGEHESFRTFFHGHTYTGNPLACAAALASISLFESENTLENVRARSDQLAQLLVPLSGQPYIAEIRQCGLMCGIELSGAPIEQRVGHMVTLAARRLGAIVRPLGDVIVLMPPLSITDQELAQLVLIVETSIGQVAKELGL